MGRIKKIKIEESAEELLSLSRKVKDPLAQARLRAYYLYKTGQMQDYAAIGQQLGYERHAIGRWSSITSSMACQLVYRSTKEAVVKPL